MDDVRFSVDLVADVVQMWSQPFMVNAFRAGTIVAVLSALTGWLVVLRRQTFVAHTLSAVGFPGAAGATLLGAGALTGYFGFCLAAAVVIALLGGRGAGRHGHESALVGTVQGFLLACGFLFVALYKGFLNGTSALLFGSFLGITGGQVTVLAVLAVLVLALLAVAGRPLLFASTDAETARVAGVPVRALDLGFLLVLGATVAAVASITGALLVFALLVLPAATAHRITARPARGLALSVLFGLVAVWSALTATYYSPYPLGFWLTSIAFAGFVTAAGGRAGLDRRHRGGRLVTVFPRDGLPGSRRTAP
ncbi:metal ABC transporter permease [Actinocatenispora comari]|uniref:ABC transporter permease n=1 Tax=Actinocatenispora comari TaxID=2807577 RepID=A0A8J4EJF7_9ACTN|nr:iron chelate uptake ABC transporter family permease subunit [Actinocatenispora comari]GIL25853.1 ABC transporter permease [Actinocatenispora comari]